MSQAEEWAGRKRETGRINLRHASYGAQPLFVESLYWVVQVIQCYQRAIMIQNAGYSGKMSKAKSVEGGMFGPQA